MQTIQLPNETVPYTAVCVALGNFDGVHKGHRKVISFCMDYAKQKGMASAVYSFYQHPKTVLSDFHKVITSPQVKAQVLEEMLNPNYLLLQNIDLDFLRQTPQQFVQAVLKNTLKAKAVVVGAHYSFGANGSGDVPLLKKLCAEAGIEVFALPLLREDGSLVSSTQVRVLLSKGNMEQANRILGYDFFVEGTVVHGNHIGNTIGFPTINVQTDAAQLLPAYGVYASVTQIDGVLYKGVSNVGVKPTVGSEKPLIETHLFDVDTDFYGKFAKISLKKQLRTEKRFSDLNALQRQIAIDTAQAKEVL